MAKKLITKRNVKKAAKVYKSSSSLVKVLVALVLILAVIGGGLYYYFFIYKNQDNTSKTAIVNGELSIHFLELGNAYTGDCIYIKAGQTDILVDGGSRTNSVETIKSYVNNYVTDGTIEYAIITHADQDHIACWAGDGSHQSLFDAYKVKTIIDFPKTNKDTQVYNRYALARDKEVTEDGAVHYTALQCYNKSNGAKRKYTLADGITLEILNNYYYDHNSSDENNFSVCFMINQGDNHYLFTGDLEEAGEKKFVESNNLPEVTLFKAGHHGSGTSNNEILLSKIKPQYVAITCVAGSVEYSSRLDNVFPYQITVDRFAKYTDNVFVTSCIQMENTGEKDSKGYDIYKNTGEVSPLNGTIIFTCNEGVISFTGTSNSTKLRDSDWFRSYRQMPAEWA